MCILKKKHTAESQLVIQMNSMVNENKRVRIKLGEKNYFTPAALISFRL